MKNDETLLLEVARAAMRYTCARYDDERDEMAALADLEAKLSTLPRPLHDKVSAKPKRRKK